MVKPPAQRWKELIIAYKKKCQKIIGVSKSVRYAGVINEYGRTLTGTIRPGVIPFWTSEQAKNEFFVVSTLMTLRKSYSQKVGALDFISMKYPKIIILVFQRKDLTYYVSIDSKAPDIEESISKIKKIL